MILRLERRPAQPEGTLGRLFVDGEPFCDTLENPPDRDKGPIPAGEYVVTLTFSERFQRPLPLVHEVPGFTGIRLHPGNTEQDTTGCILLGYHVGDAPVLAESRAAVAELLEQWPADAVTLAIVDAPSSGEG